MYTNPKTSTDMHAPNRESRSLRENKEIETQENSNRDMLIWKTFDI